MQLRRGRLGWAFVSRGGGPVVCGSLCQAKWRMKLKLFGGKQWNRMWKRHRLDLQRLQHASGEPARDGRRRSIFKRGCPLSAIIIYAVYILNYCLAREWVYAVVKFCYRIDKEVSIIWKVRLFCNAQFNCVKRIFLSGNITDICKVI